MKSSAGHQAEGAVERKFVQDGDAVGGQGLGAGSREHQVEGGIVGAEQLARMRFRR